MKRTAAALAVVAAVAAAASALAAEAVVAPTRTTFVALPGQANAVLVEPVTPSSRSRIAVLITHPERANNLSYFVGQELPKYGYRAMMLNYYGREESYYEFLQPIAAAIRALRATPGVEKVVLVGHSSGGAELTSYQDVAENGPAACQGKERVYKCPATTPADLPRADGMLLLDANTGAPEKTLALNPAVDEHRPAQVDPVLDLYAPQNGFDSAQRTATYSRNFLDRFFRAQGAKANRLIDAALARLAKIERGEGEFRDDEPFVVAGAAINAAGARAELADARLMGRTHAAHPLLKPDGRTVTQVATRIPAAPAEPYRPLLNQTTMNTTVRHYLSFQALRVTPELRMTEDDVLGVQWRSTANSMQGNLEGIRVPTLIVAATCSAEMVLLEIGFDHAAAADKQMLVVEGADHFFRPCNAQYGDTYRRTFDAVDAWLGQAGRFLAPSGL